MSPETGAQVALPGSRKVIRPKSEGQHRYVEAIRGNDVVIGIGPAGTGKTYLAVALAVDALYKKRVRRIILARPAVKRARASDSFRETCRRRSILSEAALRCFGGHDALRPVRKALEDLTIEIAPLAFMRGRTLSDAFVILDEAQNSTTAQMKMFLTRLGLNSQVVITGDKTQIDLPRREDSGLLQVEAILRGVEGIEFI